MHVPLDHDGTEIDGVVRTGDREYDDGGGGNGRLASAGLKYGCCPDGVTCDTLDAGRD